MPILYVRAKVGAPGVLSGPITAATGSGTGLVQDPIIQAANGGTYAAANYNFNLLELVPYTWSPGSTVPLTFPMHPNPASTTPGVGLGLTTGGIVGFVGQHGLQGVYPQLSGSSMMYYDPPGSPNPASGNNDGFPAGTLPNTYNTPVPTNTIDNGGQYFLNLSSQPSNMSSSDYVNRTGTPRAKDEFILISAGPDRTYGTSDDITSFGDVEP